MKTIACWTQNSGFFKLCIDNYNLVRGRLRDDLVHLRDRDRLRDCGLIDCDRLRDRDRMRARDRGRDPE